MGGSSLGGNRRVLPVIEGFLRRRDLPSFCRAKDANDPVIQVVAARRATRHLRSRRRPPHRPHRRPPQQMELLLSKYPKTANQTSPYAEARPPPLLVSASIPGLGVHHRLLLRCCTPGSTPCSQRLVIREHWLQTSTATGRLSMEEPNLQCAEHTVELTLHSPMEEHHLINARDLFIPTQENWMLLTADYSQIELRLMAHFSQDSSLIELLSRPDGDVFIMIAARWTGKMESAVRSQEREQTKRLIYGILYGMGANTLAEQLECSSEYAVE